MTGRRALVALSLLLAGGPVTSADAQQGDDGPLVIVPRAAQEDRPPTAGDEAIFDRRLEGVAVSSIGAVDPAAADLGGADVETLGEDLWRDQRGYMVSGLMERLEPHPTSRTINALAVRLLLTGAEPPKGRTARFGARRVGALQRFGRTDDAARLARAIADDGDAEARRLASDAALLAGQTDAACELADAVERSQVGADPYWTRLRGLCAAVAGRESEALFETDLLREGGVDDPAYYRLMDRLLFDFEVEVPGYTELRPMHMALLRESDLPMPPPRGDGLPAAYLPILLEELEDPADVAVLAVEAWRRALMDAAAVAQRLEAVPEAERGPLAQAYIAARDAGSPGSLTAALRRMAEEGAANERFLLSARLAADAADSLPLGAGDPELRGLLVETMIAAGELDRAYDWYEVPTPSDAPREAHLTALMIMADPETPLARSPELAARLKDAPEGLRRVGLLDALDSSRPLATGTADLADLMEAARDGRLGETVLRAANALEGRPLAEADRDRLSSVVRALHTIGLEREARDLAIEAALSPPVFAGR